MAYQDIERWEAMEKPELYQELIKLYGDVPPIDDITHIYVNNCYELDAEIEGYASNFFISLHPSSLPPEHQKIESSESIFPGDVYPWGSSPYKIELRRGPCD